MRDDGAINTPRGIDVKPARLTIEASRFGAEPRGKGDSGHRAYVGHSGRLFKSRGLTVPKHIASTQR